MKRAHVSVVLLLALGLVFVGMAPAGAAQPAKPAIVDSSTWLLRSSLSGGKATTSFKYGRVGDSALMCDWNGNGNATAAVVREVNDSLVWHIRQRNAAGAADVSLTYGILNDFPVCGDWDGDGRDTPGVVRTNDATGRLTWYLKNDLGSKPSSRRFVYGRFTDGVPVTPIVGDWNNDGTDTIGVVYARDRFYWHLRNTNSTGTAHRIFRYGANDPAYVPGTGEGPVVGDWNGDGRDTPGLVRVTSTGKLRWLLRNRNTHGNADHVFVYGRSAAGVEALSWR